MASRNVNSGKERPMKVADLEKGEKHDPRFVSFCKKSHKISIEDRKKLKENLKSVK